MQNLQISNRVSSMKPSATLGMAQAARELADAGTDVVVMSAGEPDCATHPSICQIAKAAIDQGKTHYSPVRGNKNMIAAIRHKFERDQKVKYNNNEVLCTVGAKSAIMLAIESVVNDGDEVILFAPFWVSYQEQVRLAGGIPVIVHTTKQNGFMPTAEDLRKAITPKTKALILNSPNNPTGAVISHETLAALGKMLEGSNIWLISDEIYERLLFNKAVHYSPAAINEDMKNRTILISGVSKAYAMTGWRVGIAAGNKEIISAMAALQGQQTTCLPDFVQDAAAFALMENDEVKKAIEDMLNKYTERRSFALKRIKQIPKLDVFEPAGAFYVWVDFSPYIGGIVAGQKIIDDIDLATRMLTEAHVASVPGTPFEGAGYLRFSIASSLEDIAKAFDRIEKWLSS